jgi:hypothetical protein
MIAIGMLEQSTHQPQKQRWLESPHLSFAQKSQPSEGDPETPEDFSRAFSYLETITAHFLEFGPLEEKTSMDVEHELSYHNSWHEYEVEQEQKHGNSRAEYREISLAHLRALSRRKLRALAEAGPSAVESLPVAQQMDQLIEQALTEEEALNRLTAPISSETP